MEVTHVRCITGWAGRASLYKCEPRFRWEDWVDEKMMSTKYVIISAVNNGWVHETYIFPATAKGETTSMGELPGSYKGGTSHEMAIRGMKEYTESRVSNGTT